jgi:hypothetical protein
VVSPGKFERDSVYTAQWRLAPGAQWAEPLTSRFTVRVDSEVSLMRTFLIVALVVGGLACIGAGIVYFVEPAKHLPTFFPGYARHSHLHGIHHGLVMLGIGLLAMLGAFLYARRAPRSQGRLDPA